MTEQLKEFMDALLGSQGDLDAWIEGHDEEECRYLIMEAIIHKGVIQEDRYTIASGTLTDGFQLHGVFASESEAVDYAENTHAWSGQDWQVLPIQSVSSVLVEPRGI